MRINISMPWKLVYRSLLIGSDPDEECFESHPLLTSEGDSDLNISSVENILNQEVNLIMLIPKNVTCQRFNSRMIYLQPEYKNVKSNIQLRCVFEWKYQARVNESHTWEGRHCSDISVEAGEEKEQSSSIFSDGSEEYADNNLFANYDDDDESLSESLMDARLVNNYKPEIVNETEAPESDPEAMPLQREADSNNPESGAILHAQLLVIR